MQLLTYAHNMGSSDMKEVCKMPFEGPTNITSEDAQQFKDNLYKTYKYSPSADQVILVQE